MSSGHQSDVIKSSDGPADRVVPGGPVSVSSGRPVSTGASWRVVLAVSFTVLAWASAFVVIRFVGHELLTGRTQPRQAGDRIGVPEPGDARRPVGGCR